MAEVDDAELVGGSEYNVVWLEVEVHYRAFVDRIYYVRNLSKDVEACELRKKCAVLQQFG